MSNSGFLLLFFVPIILLLGFIFARKRMKEQAMTSSTCGKTAYPGGTLNPLAWFIGPDLSHIGPAPVWGNKSPGMPAHPQKVVEGWAFDFPTQPGHKVDYVTFKHGSLTSKQRIRMMYRLDVDPGVEVLAVPEHDNGHYPAQMAPYFQREGDNWTGNGKYADYRWYATGYAPNYLQPGEHELVIEFDETKWTTVHGANPNAFREVGPHVCCMGFVFGGNDVGYGHGARATGRARFTLLEFVVE